MDHENEENPDWVSFLLAQRKQTLVIQPTSKVKGDGMQLKSIHLQPIEEY